MKTNQKNRKSRRLPTTLTEAECEAFIGQINTKTTTGLRNRAMIVTMLDAGLRVSEVVALMPADVDFGKGTVRVNLGKGRADRIVPIDAEALAWLRAWAEKRNALGLNGRQAFFCSIRDLGKALTTRAVQYTVTGLAEKAGIEKQVGPHTLRHTYASRMLDRGFTIREVQTVLGHVNVATTEVYTHVNPAALRAKIQGQPADPQVAAAAEALAGLNDEQRAELADALRSSDQTEALS